MTEENINIDKNKKEFIDSFSSKFSEKGLNKRYIID